MESGVSSHGEFQDYKRIFSILNALNEQRQTSKLCDVILKIADEHIYAHSNILASSSPYFDTLFSDLDLPRAFSQKTPQIIEIQIDGPSESDPGYAVAVQKVVEFMYTSRIRLDECVLTQVLEIARIMQMTSIIEFCDLYQQGFYSSTIGELQNPKETSDKFTQTSNGEVDTGQEIMVYNENGRDGRLISTVTYTNALNRYPVIMKEKDGFKRKRGRPRKKNLDEIICGDKELTAGGEEDMKEKNIREGENDKIIIKVSVEDNTNEPGSLELKKNNVRVSRHGRIIKPRKFSDGMISFIKEEPLSDTENDGLHSRYRNGEENAKLDKRNKKEFEEEPIIKFACEYCDFITQNMKELNEHHRKHLHADKKCSYCDWVFGGQDATEEEFNEHINTHKDSTMFSCTFCPQHFNTKAKLYQHLPKHSKTKPYVCDICSAGFKWRHALKAHMTVHKNSKDYLCDICGFATAHKTQLKSHHLIHTGDTFKCQEPGCDYQSTKRCNLKFHMMTHSREKPHQCEFCGQSFSLVKNMKRHMLLHTNDRPYRCEKCSFSTTRFDKLKDHYFKQHKIGEKPKKKLRLNDYLKMQAAAENMEGNELREEQIASHVLNIGQDMETLELQVAEDTNGLAITQIVNVTDSAGVEIPIAITNNDGEITYEIRQIPVQIITQEVETD